jgi:hypothetical protein
MGNIESKQTGGEPWLYLRRCRKVVQHQLEAVQGLVSALSLPPYLGAQYTSRNPHLEAPCMPISSPLIVTSPLPASFSPYTCRACNALVTPAPRPAPTLIYLLLTSAFNPIPPFPPV